MSQEEDRKSPRRMLFTLGCYAVLVAVGLYALLPVESQEERIVLGAFLALFALLAVKTIVHSKNSGT